MPSDNYPPPPGMMGPGPGFNPFSPGGFPPGVRPPMMGGPGHMHPGFPPGQGPMSGPPMSAQGGGGGPQQMHLMQGGAPFPGGPHGPPQVIPAPFSLLLATAPVKPLPTFGCSHHADWQPLNSYQWRRRLCGVSQLGPGS